MRVLRSGLDTLKLALTGSLPDSVIGLLRDAKERAVDSGRDAGLKLPDVNARLLVEGKATKGGYGLLWHQGYCTARWAFRKTRAAGANFIATADSAMLRTKCFAQIVDEVTSLPSALGGFVTDCTVTRADYAIDVQVESGFALTLDNIVRHPKSGVLSYPQAPEEPDKPHSVFRGKRLESATIGKLPGTQVVIYWKGTEAADKGKHYMFDLWDIPAAIARKTVLRVELRLGQRALSKAGIRRPCDIQHELRSALLELLQKVRYVDDDQTDSNVSRQTLHPLWVMITEHVKTCDLVPSAEELSMGRFADTTLDEKYRQLFLQLMGLFLRTVAVSGTTREEIASRLVNQAYSESNREKLTKVQREFAELLAAKPKPPTLSANDDSGGKSLQPVAIRATGHATMAGPATRSCLTHQPITLGGGI